MILSAGADCCTDTTAAATTTGDSTMMMANLQQTQQNEASTDFWWWSTTTAQQADGGPVTGHQHQQISSSSQQQQQLQQQQQQQQQMDTGGSGHDDEFDGFDLSLLINGTTDGYFSDASSADCRVPAAAISATVTVHTNAMLNADNECEYYPETTTATAAVTSQQQQQQLDLQQLLSIYDDMCFFSGDANEDDVKPSPIFHMQQSPAAAVVTTTTNDADSVQHTKTATSPAAVVPSMVNTTATAPPPPPATTTATTTAANHGDSVGKATLLRSLLTSSTPLPALALLSSPAPTIDSTVVVESTTEAVTAITTTTNSVPAATPTTTAASKSNKHRLLIEMLRGVKNDDVVVPTAAIRPARRRPRTAAFGADDDGEIPCGARRRMDATPSPQTDSGQGLQQDEMNDEELMLYGGPYYSVPASSSWLDRMVAAAAADTTGNCGMPWNISTQVQQQQQPQQQQEMNRRGNHQQRNIEANGGRDNIDSIVDNSYGIGNDFCNDYSIDGSGIFDQNGMDGGYFSVASNEVAYSPPTAAQVPSVTPPPASCSDPSTTTKVSDDGMVQQTCWKTTADAAVSDDYYDRLLLTVMMEAAAAEQRDEDVKPVPIFHQQKTSAAVVTTTTASCGGAAIGTADNLGSSCISSSTANGNRGGDGISNCKGNVSSADDDCSGDAASTTVDSKDSDALAQLQLKRPVTAEPRIATAMVPSTVTIPALANKTSAGATGASSSQHIHLWQFLKELLMTSSAAADQATTAADQDIAVHVTSPPSSPAASTTSNAELSPPSVVAGTATASRQQQQMIRWLDRKQGVFKIEDSQAVARLWGRRKNRPAMNYDKLSRSLRQYYKKGIMRKTERSQRLVYQFCHPYNA